MKTLSRTAKAADYIAPNDRLTSHERLEIYSRSYWYRILDSLYDDFPGLRAIIGDEAFHKLSRAYLAAHPSRSFTMRNLGHALEPGCGGAANIPAASTRWLSTWCGSNGRTSKLLTDLRPSPWGRRIYSNSGPSCA